MQLKLAVNRERNCSTKRLWSNTIQVKNIRVQIFLQKKFPDILKMQFGSTEKCRKGSYRKMAHTVNRKM